MKNKIGIVSAINSNYGTLLQAYALQQKLDSLGLDNEILYYTSSPIKQFYRIFNIPFLKMKLKALYIKLICKMRYPEIYKSLQIRDQSFAKFRTDKLRLTGKISSKSELSKLTPEYEAFVLGSDQVWNPANLEMDYYTLNFVPEHIPKITFSPSFGVSEIPARQVSKTKAYLNRIQAISVRELSGQNIIKQLTGRDIPVVCDPTALLTRNQWDTMKSDRTFMDSPYIFCYFLGGNNKHRVFANKVRQQTGYKIVALQQLDEFVSEDIVFGDLKPYDVDPSDFVNLLSNSDLVLTDSFHGTMFSIYYQKPFFTFYCDNEASKDSTNSRIDSILTLMDLADRKIDGHEDVNTCLQMTIDWPLVQKKLEIFRNASTDYLTDSLKICNII